MEAIDYSWLNKNTAALAGSWNDEYKPFKYIVIDDFLKPAVAESIYSEYPNVTSGEWSYKTYINQKNKYVLTSFDKMPMVNQVVEELNSHKFLSVLAKITDIKDLISDPQLFGGGLHQSLKGAFLDIHVDFNIHPVTKFHRRMNLIVFFNKHWEKQYEGLLELWDMKNKERIENISPDFNRCVIFETNEISFHGHPKPLKTPHGVSRKSLALYYYTQNRPEAEVAEEHNTVYMNTEGSAGIAKNFASGLKAFIERIVDKFR